MKSTSKHSTLGTVIYGMFIIVPAAILFLLLVKMTEILEQITVPLGMKSSFGAAAALLIIVVVAVAVILLISWIIGAIMRRVVSFETIESTVLNEIPGYQIIATIARGFSEGETSYAPALIELQGPGAAALGFIMEEHADGRATVYIPTAPVLTMGNIYIVDDERITRLQSGAREAADCISKWGIGTENAVAGSANKVQSD
jgi:uncharacterized membrane protein